MPAQSLAPPAPPRHDRTLVLTLLAALVLLAWEASGLDLPLARMSGTDRGFALRDHWLLVSVLHEGGRLFAWLGVLALSLGVWWPFGPLRLLSPAARLRLAASTLVAALAISLLKYVSPISCPWDLRDFGGIATHLSHWQMHTDGGAGRCFPAGHASAGFCFLGGWFAFRHVDRRIAGVWLLAALAAGFAFGVSQQLRGAHFMSHTLWTGWICWCVTWALHAGWPAATEWRDSQ